MDNIQLKKAIAEYVETLKQYSENTTTDRELLRDMFIRIFCKFYKKEYFYLAVALFNEIKHGVDDPVMKWDLTLSDALVPTFPEHPEYPGDIIKAIKKFYKFK
jgi:hypothetical protein